MKKIVALLLAVMMVFALCACGGGDSKNDEKTLVVGIDPEYPPYSYIGSDGEYTGFDIEVAQAACDLLGWKMKVFPVNWDNKLAQLDGKECDRSILRQHSGAPRQKGQPHSVLCRPQG